MRAFGIATFLLGGIVATLLITHYGLKSVATALSALGCSGFAIILVFHLVLVVLMGLAWWLLGSDRPDARWYRFVWGRLIRDGASEVLPFSQIGGFVAGARAATVSGMSGSFAAASTVVDLTMELIGQLAYTALGVSLLAWLEPGNRVVGPVTFGLAGMTGAALVFLLVQAPGAGLVEQIGLRLSSQWLGETLSSSHGVQTEIHRIHGRRRHLAISTAIHLLCWLLSGIEAWLTLHLMGIHISATAAIVIDSLIYGIRSFAFLVPNALGVQEAAYVLLGAVFGMPPSGALALSLARRGRDIALGTPVLLLWQLAEGGRAFSPDFRSPRLGIR
jgi:glycosyltransferase 2 family protein